MINRITAYLALAGGFIVTLLFAIFHIRKGGRNAERQKNTQATLEAANETIRQDAIVRDGSANIKRMSNRLSEALQRKRNP